MNRCRDLAGWMIVGFCALGCARRTDAETRAAFEAASRPREPSGKAPRERPDRRRLPTADDPRTAWQAIGELLEASITLLGSDTSVAAFTAAATGWCAVRPEPKTTRAGPTYACFPREPLAIGRRTFTLEIAPGGVVGLHMDELDEATSRSIADQARAAVARLCATPFAAVPTDDAKSSGFHTCPVDGGSTLAVGQARSTAGPGWFVTVTVLGELSSPAAGPK